MKGKKNKFIIKIGIVQKQLRAVNIIYKGEQLPLVYDVNNECVGVVKPHHNEKPHLNGQAEIWFYDEYYCNYGKYHKIFHGGDKYGNRISYE